MGDLTRDGNLTRQEASDIALAAAKEATREIMAETFSVLGVNLADFKAVQEFRADLAFVRSARESAKKMGARFVLTIVTVIAGAVAIGAWEFIKAAMKG